MLALDADGSVAPVIQGNVRELILCNTRASKVFRGRNLVQRVFRRTHTHLSVHDPIAEGEVALQARRATQLGDLARHLGVDALHECGQGDPRASRLREA